MTDIALSKSFEPSELGEMFHRSLPGMSVVLIALDALGAEPEVSLPAGSGLLSYSDLDGYYPLGIGLIGWPIPVGDGLLVALARHLSEHLACDAVCDGTVYGGDSGDPYFSVLWRSGEAWLADDCGADPYDETGEPVLLIRRLTGPMPRLGQTGRVEWP